MLMVILSYSHLSLLSTKKEYYKQTWGLVPLFFPFVRNSPRKMDGFPTKAGRSRARILIPALAQISCVTLYKPLNFYSLHLEDEENTSSRLLLQG